jgi:hypothetical protein
VDLLKYTAFGLDITSEIPFPELQPQVGDEVDRPQVLIRYGTAVISLDDPRASGVLYQVKPGEFLLNVDRIARYFVSHGRQIIVDPVAGSQLDEVRLFLLGSPMGSLLYQRGYMLLKGSAVYTPNGAIVFAGESGLYESALAAAFYKKGYEVLAGEICAAIMEGHGPIVVYPALPKITLWAEAVTALDIDRSSLQCVRTGIERYVLDIQGCFARRSSPLWVIYILDTYGDKKDRGFNLLRGKDAIEALLKCSYRPGLIDGMGLTSTHFTLVVQAARQATIKRLVPPAMRFHPEEYVDLVEKDLKL